MTKPIQNLTASYGSQLYQKVLPHITKRTAAVFFAALVALTIVSVYLTRRARITALPYFVSRTYDDNYRGKGAVGNNGIIDFVHVFSDINVAYVADTSGSADPKKRALIKPIWNKFNREFPKAYKQEKRTLEQLKEFLIDQALALDTQMREKHTSTFTLAALTSQEQQKHLTILHVGDSSLHKLSPKGNSFEVTVLTPDFETKKGFCGNELGFATNRSDKQREFFHVSHIPVQPGDRIIGVTDGITDSLKGAELNQALINFSTQRENNQATLTALIKDKITQNNQTHAGDRTKQLEYDDVGLFEIVVP